MHSPLLESLARQGGTTSGAPVDEGFTQGWGLHPFKGKLAHNWKRVECDALPDGAYGLVSACGMETVVNRQWPLFDAGTFEFCRRCEFKLMRR